MFIATVQKVPVFPGCENDADKRGCFFENMRKHIRKHFNYPKEAQEKGIQGRVNTMFTIDETGLITNLKMRGPDSLLINEASRIIGKLPKMIAGNHKGKTVAVGFSIPITFRLDNSVSPDKQSEEISGNNGVAFSVVDEVPIFPGCEGAEEKRKCFNEMMQKHIANNFRYPQEAQDKGIQGRVNVFFVIGKTGQIKSLKMRGPDVLLENEAKRIIGLLPNMVPGKDEGKVVNVPYSIPISFKLSSEFEYGGKENGKDIYVSDSGTKIYSNGGLPIFIIDGIEDTANLMGEIDASNIESMNVVNGKAAIEKYGDRAKYGVVEVITKGHTEKELSTSETPIYVLDGVATTKEYVETINPDTIESVNVLKGKAAKDKYGEKGKNGIIEITLKKKD